MVSPCLLPRLFNFLHMLLFVKCHLRTFSGVRRWVGGAFEGRMHSFQGLALTEFERLAFSFVNGNTKCEANLLARRSKNSGRISSTPRYVHISVYVCILSDHYYDYYDYYYCETFVLQPKHVTCCFKPLGWATHKT